MSATPYILLGAIVVAIIGFAIYRFFSWFRTQERLVSTRKLVDKLSGETRNKASEELKKKVESVPRQERTPEESYDRFLVYYWHDKDEENARDAAGEVLEKIAGRANAEDDWIADRMQRALFDDAAAQVLRKREEAVAKKAEEKKGSSQKGPAAIKKKVKWKSDSQNVHDSAINDDLRKQYEKIVRENGVTSSGPRRQTGSRYQQLGRAVDTDRDILNTAFGEASEWMLRTAPARKKEAVSKVLKRMAQGSTLISLGKNVKEDVFLAHLWLRSSHPSNRLNTLNIRTSLRGAVADCYEGKNIVCSTGRAARLMASLAFVDSDDKMGSVKSKDMLQNEFLEGCADIVRKVRASLTPEARNAYDRSDPSVQEVVDNMKERMERLSQKYRGKLDDTRLSRLLKECQDSA